ncbi:MAG: PKD domain-containing protein [Desulfohalobiaceae bacterium]|nr:PKD domain-containing protein [Desulfohalobiaceae bacterium]
MVDGHAGYLEGDRQKMAQSAAYLFIGAAGLVPGGQVPAMVAGLGMASIQLGASAWHVGAEKELIQAVLDSGKFDPDTGRLQKVRTKEGGETAPEFSSLVGDGERYFQNGLPGRAIRDAVYDWGERYFLPGAKEFDLLRQGFASLYPDFDLDQNLREKLNTGRSLLAARILEQGGNPGRDAAMAMFVQLKRIYDQAGQAAFAQIVDVAEQEYQARHHTGQALEISKELRALGRRLHLPLVENTEDIFNSFSSFARKTLTSPWVRNSLRLQKVNLQKKYLKGYLEIEAHIEDMTRRLRQVGVNPPRNWHMTGYLEIDGSRIQDLKNAYLSQGLHRARKDAGSILEKAGQQGKLDLSDPCHAQLFQKLAKIRVSLVHRRDLKLLMAQWQGKELIAAQSRDQALAEAEQEITERSIFFAAMDRLAKAHEEAYAWASASLPWSGGYEVYAQAEEAVHTQIAKLEAEYARALEYGAKDYQACRGEEPGPAVIEEEQTAAGKGAEDIADEEDIRDKSGKEAGRDAQKQGEADQVSQPEMSGKDAEKEQQTSSDEPGFTAILPGIWKCTYIEQESGLKFKLERTTASMQNKDTEKCPKKASVWAELWGKLNPSFHPQTEEEIRSELEEEIKNKKWEDIARLRPLRIQDFAGWFYDIEVDYSKGWASPMLGYHRSGVDVHGHGYVLKGRECIEVKYGIGGSGCYNNSDRAFLESQARAAREEARGIIASLKLVPNGEFTTVPYTGPELDGSDLLQVEIEPAAKGPYRAGQVVDLQAAVSGGKVPYTYAWEGNLGTAARPGPTASFTASKPGTYPVTVTVRDKAGSQAEAGLNLEVEALQAEVKGVLPEVVYGQKAVLSVDVKGGLPGGGTGPQSLQVGENQAYVPNPDEEDEGSGLIFIWQSSPELAFARGTTSVPTTTVTYDRMGPVKIWAQILSQEGEARTTIGETPQISATLKAPAFTISFDPEQGRVGQEVRARIVSEPAVADDLIDYRWFSPKSSNRMEYANNSGVIGFTVPESGKMDLMVLARVPVHGDEISEITAGYTGGGYQVQVTVQEQGPPAMTWDPKTGGLVKIPQGNHATGARIFLQAELVGQPQPVVVRWQWTVNEGTFISNDISRTPTVSRSEPGAIAAEVEARNADDQLLGKGSISLPVVAVHAGPGTPEEPASKSSGNISVQSATYGGNCGVDPGNVTDHITEACNGKSECTYTVDYKVIGDPAYGCQKTYVVTYRCGTDTQVYEQRLSAEAGWGDKAVVLKCSPDAQDRQIQREGKNQTAAGDMSGWKASNAGFEATQGQISASPAADGKTSYYTAPDVILGDWSNVTHILLEKKSSGGRYYKGSHGDIGDIVLQGPTGSASYRLAEDHSGEWKAYRVPLNDQTWTFVDGADSMADILPDITSFRIRAEYGYGADTSAIRRIQLIRQ